jgi:hypothetical protein
MAQLSELPLAGSGPGEAFPTGKNPVNDCQQSYVPRRRAPHLDTAASIASLGVWLQQFLASEP